MASLDPFTGQEVYSANNVSAGIAIDSLQGYGIDAPLAFRMMEHIPGLPTSAGFSTARGTGTIMRGGFLDETKRFRGSRAAKYRVMQDGVVSARNPAQFMRGQRADGLLGRGLGAFNGRFGTNIQRPQGPLARRAVRLSNEGIHSGTLRSMRVNNVTARPRALSRFHSLSVFGEGNYTPFSASRMLGNFNPIRERLKKQGIGVADGQSAFGSGLFSFITAGRKADVLERRAMSGSTRALGKLGQLDNSIASLARMNNPTFIKGARIKSFVPSAGVRGDVVYTHGRARVAKGATMNIYTQSGDDMIKRTFTAGQFIPRDSQTPIFSRGPSAFQSASRTMVTGEGIGQIGVRGDMLASSMSGSGTRYLAGYGRGALGQGKHAVGEARAGALKAVGHFETALGKAGIKGTGSMLEGSVIRNLGGSGFIKTLATKEGAAVLGARGLAMAIPGLNILATASLVYDLGKMAGEVVKSGINLAKDATKSMKGTIYKPVFGMGYKDTEAAATSRARGVMAIQNSQLNARSALGNEAALMAAHFG